MTDLIATEMSRGADSIKNTLKHYGKKGMKWGVRKSRSTSSSPLSEDAARARALLSKPATSASNSDIQAALNRMKLEADFNKVQVSLIPPSRGARAAAFAKKLVGEIGTEQVTRVSRTAASVAVEAALMKGGKVDLDKEFAKTVGKRLVPKKK